MTSRLALVTIAALTALAAPARADELAARVLVPPSEGSAPKSMPDLGTKVADALARGAAQTTTTVTRAGATLTDTAVVVGCDLSARTCLDAVAAALNVDQILFAKITPDPNDPDTAQVDVTAVTRETEPVTRSFTVHAASTDDDLAAIEPAAVEMLQTGESRRRSGSTPPDNTKPPPPPPPPPAPLPPAAPTETRSATLPLVATITGAVVVAAGATCWAVASSKQGQIDSAPTTTAADLEHLASLESSAKGYATAGNVLVISGAVVTLAGGALWWRARHGHHHGKVAVTPAVGADRAMLVVGGAW